MQRAVNKHNMNLCKTCTQTSFWAVLKKKRVVHYCNAAHRPGKFCIANKDGLLADRNVLVQAVPLPFELTVFHASLKKGSEKHAHEQL